MQQRKNNRDELKRMSSERKLVVFQLALAIMLAGQLCVFDDKTDLKSK